MAHESNPAVVMHRGNRASAKQPRALAKSFDAAVTWFQITQEARQWRRIV
jgi:hypothetical protein